MQIGIRFHDTKPGTLEERIARIQKQGFSCVQLALYAAVKDYSVEDEALVPGYAAYLKRLFSKYQMDIAVLGCYKNLANPDPVQLTKIQQSYFAHIRLASLLGCGVVGTETGTPNAEYVYEPAAHSEAALEKFIQNLSPVAACAEKFGVILALEPVWHHIVYNVDRARRVLDVIHSPNLQIILDPVNLLAFENYQQCENIFQEAFAKLEAEIAVVHLKDFRVVGNKLQETAAGEGMMDYTSLFRFIKMKKPFLQVSLENTIPENAVQVREHMQKVYEQV